MDALSARAWKNGHAIKIIVSLNFLLLAVAIVLDMAGGKSVDAALKAAGIDNAVAGGVQLWMSGSTLLATGMFVWRLIKEPRGDDRSQRPARAVAVDGVILLAWWLTLVILCVYGFMLGMAA